MALIRPIPSKSVTIGDTADVRSVGSNYDLMLNGSYRYNQSGSPFPLTGNNFSATVSGSIVTITITNDCYIYLANKVYNSPGGNVVLANNVLVSAGKTYTIDMTYSVGLTLFDYTM